jgi:hypothetical protein
MTMHTDLSVLNSLFKADRTRIGQWVTLYLEEAPKLFAALLVAQRNGDIPAITHAIHDLKPMAHYLGSAGCIQALIALEQSLLDGDADMREALVGELMALEREMDVELRTLILTL